MGTQLKKFSFKNDHGFTLIELMIAIVLSLIVSFAIYQTFEGQNKSYIIQDRNAEMQQTLRTALLTIERDLRNAGFDFMDTGLFGIVSASATQLSFTIDINRNGIVDSQETFNYQLFDSATDSDNNANELQRIAGDPPIGYHIEQLQFAYAYDSDGDGFAERNANNTIWAIPSGGTWFNLDTNNDGLISAADIPGGIDTTTPVDIQDIKAVRVWILVQQFRNDMDYLNTNTYVAGAVHVVTPNDTKRRIILNIQVKLRNL